MAEAAITAAAIQLGLTVLRPLCEGRRYDLVIDLEPGLLRVQCKLARRIKGVLAVCLETNLRLDPTGNSQAQGIKWARDYDFRLEDRRDGEDTAGPHS